MHYTYYATAPRESAKVQQPAHPFNQHINQANDGNPPECFCMGGPYVSRHDLTPEIAKRTKVERTIVKRTIRDLLKAGFTLGVMDGEEVTIHHSADFHAIYAAMFTTDEDYLFVYNSDDTKPDDTRPYSWVRCVYGNDGWDVISDFLTNIDTIVDPIMEWADKTYCK